MILFNKGEKNTLVFTLSDLSIYDNPTYKLIFTNQATNKSEATIPSVDTSVATYRYNRFIISDVSSNPKRFSGETSLNNYGFFDYQVEEFETRPSAITESGRVVETGIMKVFNRPDNNKVYTQQENVQNKTYKG